VATEDFRGGSQAGGGGLRGGCSPGTLHHTPVAIKVLRDADAMQAANEFQQEVRNPPSPPPFSPSTPPPLPPPDGIVLFRRAPQPVVTLFVVPLPFGTPVVQVEVLGQIQHPHVVMHSGSNCV